MINQTASTIFTSIVGASGALMAATSCISALGFHAVSLCFNDQFAGRDGKEPNITYPSKLLALTSVVSFGIMHHFGSSEPIISTMAFSALALSSAASTLIFIPGSLLACFAAAFTKDSNGNTMGGFR